MNENQSIDEKALALLLELNELKEKVKQMTLKSALETVQSNTQLSAEIIEPIIAPYVEKKFKLNHPPLEGEIRHAISKTKSLKEASRYLGVSFNTFKKYCKFYDENRTDNRNDLLLWKSKRTGQSKNV